MRGKFLLVYIKLYSLYHVIIIKLRFSPLRQLMTFPEAFWEWVSTLVCYFIIKLGFGVGDRILGVILSLASLPKTIFLVENKLLPFDKNSKAASFHQEINISKKNVISKFVGELMVNDPFALLDSWLMIYARQSRHLLHF